MNIITWQCPETEGYYDAVVTSTSVPHKIEQLKQCNFINEYENHFEIPLNDLEDDDICKYPKYLRTKLLEAKNKAELYIIKVVK